MTGRLALCAAVVAGCMLTGQAFAGGELRRYRLLVKTCAALQSLRIQMLHLMEPLERALRASGSELFAAVADELSETESVPDAWRRALERTGRRGGGADCLGGEERRILGGLFARLGESDRESQRISVQACAEELEGLREDCRERAARAQRLYLSLGFLTGLAIAVMML